MRRSDLFAFLLLVTLLATFHGGVRFALIDQQVHLPRTYKDLDPSLYPRDFTYATQPQFGPRFVVNGLIAAAARVAPMEAVSLVTILLVNFLVLWITYRTGRMLFGETGHTPLIAVVLVGALGGSVIPLGGLITSELDPRALGMPVALWSLLLALRGKPVWCAVVALAGSLIHPTLLINTMLAALMAMGLAWLGGLFTHKRDWPAAARELAGIAAGAALFVAVSYYLWMVRYDVSGVDTKTLFELLQFRTPRSYTLWEFWGPRPFLLYAVFAGAAAWAWRWWVSETPVADRTSFTALGLIAGTTVLLAGAVVFVEFIPVRTWLSLDASSGVFITRWIGLLLIARSISVVTQRALAGEPGAFGSSLVLAAGTGTAMPLTAVWGHLIEAIRRRRIGRASLPAIRAGMLAATTAAVFLWVMNGSQPDVVALALLGAVGFWFAATPDRAFRWIVPLIASVLVVAAVFLLNGRIHSPRVTRVTSFFNQVVTLKDARRLPEEGEMFAALDDVATFARNNTPKDALFLTPPVGAYFRLVSRRSVVVDFKGMPANTKGMLEWRQRLADCYRPTTKRGFEAVNDMDAGYRRITREHLAFIRRKYGADYALLYAETPNAGLPVMYRNSRYALVSLAPLDAGP